MALVFTFSKKEIIIVNAECTTLKYRLWLWFVIQCFQGKNTDLIWCYETYSHLSPNEIIYSKACCISLPTSVWQWIYTLIWELILMYVILISVLIYTFKHCILWYDLWLLILKMTLYINMKNSGFDLSVELFFLNSIKWD